MTETSGKRPAAWPEFLECAESSVARARLKGKLTRIRKAHRAGDKKRFRYLLQEYLTSFEARLAATRLAARKMRWDRRPKKSELKSIAEKLNAFQGTQEAATLILIRKGPGKFRPTLDFGIENRALQYLVLSVLYAIAELHPRQFATRGVPAAIAPVIKPIKAGYVHAREIDIKDFYPSCVGSKLVELIPIQKRVIERVLVSDRLNIVASTLHHTASACSHSTHYETAGAHQGALYGASPSSSCFGPADTDQGELSPLEKCRADARRGLPQGSAASPILAEMLLAPLLFQVPIWVEVVAYADNILVMAKSESDADAMTESLGLALKKHPAGPLWPKIKSFVLGGPIEFLGHRITDQGDDVRVQPIPENREKFERKMKRGLARLRKPGLAPAARTRLVRELKSELSSHAANFRLCDGMKEYRQHWSAQIASAKHGGSTMPQSKQPSTKRMVFWLHPDQEEIFTAALNRAKQEIPTQFQTVALEAIAMSFMSTGMAFKDWRQALAFARKHSQDATTFAQKALSFVEELCPEVVIEATITAKVTNQKTEAAGESIGPTVG
jgi:hypothetical protein